MHKELDMYWVIFTKFCKKKSIVLFKRSLIFIKRLISHLLHALTALTLLMTYMCW